MNSQEPLSQNEIDRINELHKGIKKAARKMLNDALEIGDSFLKAQKKVTHKSGPGGIWGSWMEENFPDIGASSIYQYMRLASKRDFLENLSRAREIPSIREAIRLIQHDERVRRTPHDPVITPDADPLVRLEAKLINYTIGLYQLRVLETEIFGLLGALELAPEQLHRALTHVTKGHMEVKDEVMKTFSPYPRLLKKANGLTDPNKS